MGQITATRNLVVTKVVRHAGQSQNSITSYGIIRSKWALNDSFPSIHNNWNDQRRFLKGMQITFADRQTHDYHCSIGQCGMQSHNDAYVALHDTINVLSYICRTALKLHIILSRVTWVIHLTTNFSFRTITLNKLHPHIKQTSLNINCNYYVILKIFVIK